MWGGCDGAQRQALSFNFALALQMEKKEHGRLIELYGKGPTTEDGTRVVHFLRYLEFDILPAQSTTRVTASSLVSSAFVSYLFSSRDSPPAGLSQPPLTVHTHLRARAHTR